MNDRDVFGLPALKRRRFFEVCGTAGFTTATLALVGGTLWSSEAVAQSAQEEAEREAAAEHTMTVATAYTLFADRSYPIMQLDFKENVQNATDGKVYVKLAPGGQLGAGGALVQKVQSGTVQAAQHSLSNFAPFAPVVDLINLPYFCGSNQRFVNLVTSQAWRDEVNPLVEAKGFKPLFYVVIDPRVVALRQGVEGPVKRPADLKGIKFRVPGSQMLQQYYQMVGANPTPIAWGETSSAIKQGVADALDPSIGALFVFGFKDILSWVSFTQAVPDSQVYSCNLEWFNGLPGDVQEGLTWASTMTAHQNLAKVPSARTYAMYEMRKAGVQFYTLSDDEMAEWKETAGYQRPEWDNFKQELAGSMNVFKDLEAAAETPGRYYVNDA